MTGHRDDLGTTLRAWRDRLAPSAAGLAPGGARRSPGLRREELAALAGISVDYLVRLEQGRAASPSPQVLASLARALRLTPGERDHLYRQGGQAPPSRTTISAHIPPGVQRLIDRLGDAAVAVYDAAWTLIVWNPTWAALMGDPSSWVGRDRNLIWRYFTRPSEAASRVVHAPEEAPDFERSMAADLRDAAGRYPDDAGLHGLIADLRRSSPRFAEVWQEHRVGSRHADRKTVRHPEAGPITLDCDVLTVTGSDLRIIVYTADPASADASKLALIATIGLQGMASG
ncbi:MAG TPA: helix-turn-helix transcriptional regulator [Streptosporangiaceae bacterium]|jgi:transcriptional regulator with XRE-family HTH domain|nr:helix-turn-helix transcriptional regulator [Streptosporangiaceae bacterium]